MAPDKIRTAFSFLNKAKEAKNTYEDCDVQQAFSFLNAVENNKKMFKARDVRKADEARLLHRRTNHMATDKFARVVSKGFIRNCPVTVGDARRAEVIYGPSLPSLRGRTRAQAANRAPDIMNVPLPKELYEDLKNVTVCMDFFYVNGMPIFHTISRKLDYRTVSFPVSRSKPVMLKEYRKVRQRYHSRGFRITSVLTDKEFETIRNDVRPAVLQVCGTDEHVPEVERSIQTLKNDSRSVCHAMPYQCLPKIMVRELVTQGNEYLNAFGSKDNIGRNLSPRNIIDNLPHVDFNDIKYEFGQRVELHVAATRTNTMASRSTEALVLGPKNITGDYTFMSLQTGREIDGRVVGELPITQDVVDLVDQLGRDQQQPFRTSKMLKYE